MSNDSTRLLSSFHRLVGEFLLLRLWSSCIFSSLVDNLNFLHVSGMVSVIWCNGCIFIAVPHRCELMIHCRTFDTENCVDSVTPRGASTCIIDTLYTTVVYCCVTWQQMCQCESDISSSGVLSIVKAISWIEWIDIGTIGLHVIYVPSHWISNRSWKRGEKKNSRNGWF